jgi:hypothetical protein
MKREKQRDKCWMECWWCGYWRVLEGMSTGVVVDVLVPVRYGESVDTGKVLDVWILSQYAIIYLFYPRTDP